MTTAEIFLGLGLLLAAAVGGQIAAVKLGIPAIVVLLPAGFILGSVTQVLDPDELFGRSFSPMVGLAVAVILFDAGLDLDRRELEGHSNRVVRRLILWGVPLTWFGAGMAALLLLDLSGKAAVMLGAILIVSGPTVVGPLLEAIRPGRRLTAILGWESTAIDPIGAIIGVLVVQALRAGVRLQVGREVVDFISSVALGLAGGVVGLLLLWLLVQKAHLVGVLATEATLAIVISVAATCNAISADTGLIAAIAMGVGVANLPTHESPEDRAFFRTIVQLIIGLLFISISSTVAAGSVTHVVWATAGLVACLVLIVRPVVAAVATFGTDLSARERVFIGAMNPRGIVAASTAATVGIPLARAGIVGAEELLPATFLVIVGTVTIYGLGARPLARRLGLMTSAPPADDGDADVSRRPS